MIDTLSQDEIARRIAALLNTRRTGQAVADYLERQHAEPQAGAAPPVPPSRPAETRAERVRSDG